MPELSKGRCAISCRELKKINVGNDCPSRHYGRSNSRMTIVIEKANDSASAYFCDSSETCLKIYQLSSVPKRTALPDLLLKASTPQKVTRRVIF